MNTMKKILMLALAMTLLVCVALSFASCNLIGNSGDHSDEHCPADCECREDDKASIPEGHHCPADCECRLGDIGVSTEPAKLTYLVVVRDDQGKIVSGVDVKLSNRNGDATLSQDKTTDSTGVITFPLVQSSWIVNVTNAPVGYNFDGAQKYYFNADGVCEIVLEKAVGYTFVAKSAYGEKLAVEGIFASLYAWDEEIGWYDESVAVAEGTTDANGAVTLEAPAGKYMVVFYVNETSYASEVYIDVASDVYEVEVLDYEGSVNNPIFSMGSELYIDLELGAEKWYAIEWAAGKTLTIEDPDVYVIYNEENYLPVEGKIEITFDALADGEEAVLAIGYASEAEDAEEFKSITATVLAPLGSMDNPIILNDISELPAAISLEANAAGNEIYYKWTPTFSGRLFLLCDNENNFITIQCGNYASEGEEGAAVINCDFLEGVDTTICVSAVSGWDYVAAELAITPVIYGKYTVDVFGFDGNGLAGETVTITDAEGNVVATLTTDLNGSAETYLPLAAYTIASTVPAGYTSGSYELATGDTYAFFYASAYALGEPQEIVTKLGTITGYQFDLAAGEFRYYTTRVDGDYKFKIENAPMTMKITYNGMDYFPNRIGTIEVDFTADPMNRGKVDFTITNTDTEYALSAIATLESALPGLTWADPIEITEGEYVANFDYSVYTDGAIYHIYTATEDGVLTITTTNSEALIIVGYDPYAGDELNVSESNPMVITVNVTAGEMINIDVGAISSVDVADIAFTVSFTPSAEGI